MHLNALEIILIVVGCLVAVLAVSVGVMAYKVGGIKTLYDDLKGMTGCCTLSGATTPEAGPITHADCTTAGGTWKFFQSCPLAPAS